MPRRPQPGSRGFDASVPGGNRRDLDGDPLAGEDDPDLDADRAITRLLARWFPAPVDPRTSLEEPDIREPGPDSANVSNSPYTLPRGWVYLENEPVGVHDERSRPADGDGQLGVSAPHRADGPGGVPPVRQRPDGGRRGSRRRRHERPLVFDTKIHFSDEVPEWFMPATGMEVNVQTPWGSPAFDVGTQPGIMMLFRNSLPWGIEAESNVGVVGDQASGDAVGFTDAVQWAFQKRVAEELTLFVQGFKNQAALPRVANQTVLGGCFIRTFGRRFALFGSWNAATDRAGHASTIQLGGAGAF